MDISEAVAALREAVPEFEPVYALQLKKWSRSPGGLRDYQAIYDFGYDFLKARLSTESTGGPVDEIVQRTLNTLERRLERGDSLVADAVYFGIIDTIVLQSDKLWKYTLGPLTMRELGHAQSAFPGLI